MVNFCIYVWILTSTSNKSHHDSSGEEHCLEYEGLHAICFNCGRYGHKREHCPEVILPAIYPSNLNGNEPLPLSQENNQAKHKLLETKKAPADETPKGFGPWIMAKKTPKSKPLKSLNQSNNQLEIESRFTALENEKEVREKDPQTRPGKENQSHHETIKPQYGPTKNTRNFPTRYRPTRTWSLPIRRNPNHKWNCR